MEFMLALVVPIGLGGALLFVLWMWAIFDVISTDSILVRNAPKGTWLFLVIFIPTVGAVAWLILGRPEGAGTSLGSRDQRHRSRSRPSSVRGLEDSPEWRNASSPSRPSSAERKSKESLVIRERRLLEREAELAKREAQIEAQDPGASSEDPGETGDPA